MVNIVINYQFLIFFKINFCWTEVHFVEPLVPSVSDFGWLPEFQSQQWRIYTQKFLAPPPTGPNSFVVTYVFTKMCPCRRLAPPPTKVGAPQREIVDPPLVRVDRSSHALFCHLCVQRSAESSLVAGTKHQPRSLAPPASTIPLHQPNPANQLLISQFLIYFLFHIQQEKMLVHNIWFAHVLF